MLKSFSTALSFLTVIRTPFSGATLLPRQLAASFACFPLAGLVLGALYYAAAVLLQGRVPVLLLSVLIATLTVLLTRGLHLDGLADFADGIWGGATPERRLEIMKDSRSGAFGVLALIVAVSLRIGSFHALLSTAFLSPLLLAPVFARFAMVAAAFGGRYARPQGLGKPFLENIRRHHLALAALFTALAAAAIDYHALAYFIFALAVAIFIRISSNRLLGGVTGDVLGTVSEVTEIGILVLGACSAGP